MRRAVRRSAPHDGVALIGVYRRRNAAHVRALVDDALAAGWATSWWALDEVAPELAEHTAGSGPGDKFPLLNLLVDTIAAPKGWIVAADDDVVFVRGNVLDLVAVCAAAGFALAQPAHTADSTHTHEINVSRALSVARRTTFVEIGPVFVIAPACRRLVVPFPTDRRMGWGLEIVWRELLQRGCALGVVDAVTVRHLGPVGAAYESVELTESVIDELASAGAARWQDLQSTLETWRPWQRHPPWASRLSPSSAWARVGSGSS